MLRRSLAGLVLVGGLATLCWPLVAIILDSFGSDSPTAATPMLHDPLVLTLRTIAWSVGVGLVAMALGWIPGRVLGGLLHARRQSGARGWPIALALILFPLLVPSYALFYAWWQTWPAGSWLFDRLVAWDAVGFGRTVTLAVALVSWSWPLVALCVAPAAATWPRSRSDQLQTDGASWWQRARARMHHDGGGLLLGGLLVAAFVFGNVICFDLAGVFTVGNELRALAAMKAGPSAMVWVSIPAGAAAILAAGITWWTLGRPIDDAAPEPAPIGRGAWAMLVITWGLTVLVPVVLVFVGLNAASLDLWAGHGESIGRDAIRALITGGLVIIVFLGLLALLRAESRPWRCIGNALSILWFAALLAPGSLVAAMVLAGVTMLPWTSVQAWLLRDGAALFIGLVARFGGLAALAARWIVWSEPTPLRDLRRLNPGGWRAEGPRTWLMAAGVGAVSGLLALGEIPVSMLLTPPAPSPPISVTLLNAMHYQRPDTVVAVLALLVVVGLVVASGLGGASLVMARRVSNAPAVLLLAFSIMLVGCSSDPEEGPVPLTVDSIIGGAGHAPGRFDYPRAIDVDAQTGELFVVDKSGRVQRLDPEGRPLASWTMPRINQGRPTGITIGPRGNIWVADTHEHRVMVYGPDGEWKQQVGSYGTGPGQFIYPTDIAFGDDDVVFVSEYGGNDRIQVFTIDGEWIRTIGGTGTAPGMFDRPQSMCISPDGRTMAVADSRNQRIQLMDLASGDWRVLRQGGYEGDLRTPFSVWFRDDGSLLVSDTGTNLLLHLSADGEILAANGGWGWGPGQLRDPWAVVEQGGTTLVLDSGNNRILRLNPGEP